MALELLLGVRGIVGGTRIRMMTLGAVGYVIGTLTITAHAYAGLSMLEPTPMLLAGIGVSLVSLVASFAGALRLPQPVSA